MARPEHDCYITPEHAVKELLAELVPLLSDTPNILDPGTGTGALGRLCRRHWPLARIHGVEIDEALYTPLDREGGKDRSALYQHMRHDNFLLTQPDTLPAMDLLICNPPFSAVQDFITHGLRFNAFITAFLTRLNFLGSQRRHAWWLANPPDAIRVLSARPSFLGSTRTDMTEYMWVIWADELPNTCPVLSWYEAMPESVPDLPDPDFHPRRDRRILPGETPHANALLRQLFEEGQRP